MGELRVAIAWLGEAEVFDSGWCSGCPGVQVMAPAKRFGTLEGRSFKVLKSAGGADLAAGHGIFLMPGFARHHERQQDSSKT